ncbi:hypothetical protein Cyrtocomes_00980 [Candidatus Cyrtobacter comes]|uniref:Uncharacterized protein n=1 Tax=Candidatus Cyrtobacter comes TaxID=675776 RepID=A0ABU5L9K8_9RICK|nr:hypothetical protein [Candidatus Cyrtobacter comes]MDZ5762590.1 hypothetical protein [Candidatus Cyrtobacter comes]
MNKMWSKALEELKASWDKSMKEKLYWKDDAKGFRSNYIDTGKPIRPIDVQDQLFRNLIDITLRHKNSQLMLHSYMIEEIKKFRDSLYKESTYDTEEQFIEHLTEIDLNCDSLCTLSNLIWHLHEIGYRGVPIDEKLLKMNDQHMITNLPEAIDIKLNEKGPEEIKSLANNYLSLIKIICAFTSISLMQFGNVEEFQTKIYRFSSLPEVKHPLLYPAHDTSPAPTSRQNPTDGAASWAAATWAGNVVDRRDNSKEPEGRKK